MVHWTQLDAYYDVAEAMQRMEMVPSNFRCRRLCIVLARKGVVLVFDDVHTISQRHEPSFSLLFKTARERYSVRLDWPRP